MKKYISISLLFIGLISILSSCEKEGDKVVMLEEPVVPTITYMPSLILTRATGANTLEFTGTPVDPGFNASATYFLEASANGNSFSDPVVIASDVQDTLFTISVSELNGILLKKFPSDQFSTVDFRIRAVLVVDAGTGAPGTGSNPFVYVSPADTVDVYLYGLPKLNLISNLINIGKIESPLGDGKYSGFVKLDATEPFTLKDPEANNTYGGSNGTLSLNGAAIVPEANGWHKMSADVTALTYSIETYMIGLVGSATPNGWDSPDQKMDYDGASGTWRITINLVAGDIKFRLNDGWAWNLGGTKDKLVHGGDNIPVTPGNYTITLTITNATQGSETGTFTIVKNN